MTVKGFGAGQHFHMIFMTLFINTGRRKYSITHKLEKNGVRLHLKITSGVCSDSMMPLVPKEELTGINKLSRE